VKRDVYFTVAVGLGIVSVATRDPLFIFVTLGVFSYSVIFLFREWQFRQLIGIPHTKRWWCHHTTSVSSAQAHVYILSCLHLRNLLPPSQNKCNSRTDEGWKMTKVPFVFYEKDLAIDLSFLEAFRVSCVLWLVSQNCTLCGTNFES
jgi:hypothetical protein